MSAKIIKVFIASSIREFREEREKLGFFISGINNKFIERGIYCKMEFCENEEQAMSGSARKQDDYNALIKDADAVFVLFFKKAGSYTLEELEFAHKCFVENGKPRVYTYFKNFDEAALTDEARVAYDIIVNKHQHFFSTFENIATVELDILRTMFDITSEPSLKITEEGGTVYMGTEPVMQADELDYIKNSKAIAELKARLAGLNTGEAKYIAGLYGDEEIGAEIQRCEALLADRYKKCFAALEARYSNIASAAKIDAELQAAYNAYARGDYATVLKIISLEKLKNETKKTVEENKTALRRYYETIFNKYLQRINALTEQGELTELEETYASAVEAITALHLYDVEVGCLDTWYDFVSFLEKQNKSKKAIALGERLEAVYGLKSESVDNYDKAGLYNLLGMLYSYQNNPEKTELYYLKAMEIREALAGENPEGCNADLADSYNNIGVFYKDCGVFDKAEKYFLKAMELREALADKAPELYNADLASSYNNAGIFYKGQEQPDKAEAYYIKAIEIREALACEKPERYASDLADSYNNTGNLYSEYGFPENAELCYLKAIELREALARENPERYNADLADSYGNAGVFYKNQGQPDRAEEHYLKAMEMYQVLAAENPERYNADLAMSYNNAGIFYKLQGQPDRAEEYYLKAMEIYQALVEENPERYTSVLAVSYYNYAIFKERDDYFKKSYLLAKTAMHDPYCRKITEALKNMLEEN